MKQRKAPVRTCVSCRESGDKKSLLRIVRNPDGGIEIDVSGKKAGRGAYICANGECLRRAIKEKRFTRALKAEVPEEITRELELIIERGPSEM